MCQKERRCGPRCAAATFSDKRRNYDTGHFGPVWYAHRGLHMTPVSGLTAQYALPKSGGTWHSPPHGRTEAGLGNPSVSGASPAPENSPNRFRCRLRGPIYGSELDLQMILRRQS